MIKRDAGEKKESADGEKIGRKVERDKREPERKI
jgi:hypothetical protein